MSTVIISSRVAKARNADETRKLKAAKVTSILDKRAEVSRLLRLLDRPTTYIAGRPLKDAQAGALNAALQRLRDECERFGIEVGV